LNFVHADTIRQETHQWKELIAGANGVLTTGRGMWFCVAE